MTEAVAVPIVELPPVLQEALEMPDPGKVEVDEGFDIDSYRGTHQTPYVADYFGVKDMYGANEDATHMVDTITNHLRSKTEGDTTVYIVKQILDGYADEMNLDDKDAGYYRLKKAFQLIEARTKLERINQQRQQAIDDIAQMG